MLLDNIFIKDIRGTFNVPSYQRGYRWKEEALILLQDLLDINYRTSDSFYCLQPIVVKRTGEDTYDLIDGQQRLTTILILYKVMKDLGGLKNYKPKYNIKYEIRTKSEEFLNTLGPDSSEEYIDYHFMKNAYMAFYNKFKSEDDPDATIYRLNLVMSELVKVIWYEVDDDIDPIKLFERLNIGKIPLTSSELIKAIFLSDSNKEINQDKQEIALQWDSIEKELHNDRLWLFLTNDTSGKYQTRIDLLLNLYSGCSVDDKEKYSSFYFFDDLRKEIKEGRSDYHSLKDVWKDIQRQFLILKDWFNNVDLYHKIGYLISIGTPLKKIYQLSLKRNKDDFNNELDKLIASGFDKEANIGEYSYENSREYRLIKNVLLLYNVMWMKQKAESGVWFPFDIYKTDKWTLEHIHAQQSQGLKTDADMKEWLSLQAESLKKIAGYDETLYNEMINAARSVDNVSGNSFRSLQDKFFAFINQYSAVENMHCIANLALLDLENNAAINNSTFDVKRNKIIQKEKEGHYILPCTRNVFLKYYSSSNETQLHFWGKEDQDAYIEDISNTLKDYINKIELGLGVNENE